MGDFLLLFEQRALPLQLLRERAANLAVSFLISVIPKSVVAMAIIDPAGVIQHWIETNSVKRHAGSDCDSRLFANVTEPTGAVSLFGAGFGDEHWAAITLVDLKQDLVERAVARIGARNHFAAILPLIVRVVIDADDVEVFGVAAQFGADFTGNHVPGLVL